ncbi:DUF6807 domain-containing protein [Streptomyces milbemycinicus]|uniref:PmoA family protein n=1 Tax=Streptomyces milbemycinicus TaxID=476552 RepID=A0ABW8LGP8_9ACTN
MNRSLTNRPPCTVLRCDGRPVGTYTHRPQLPDALSPRPYLHPVRTLAGITVTESRPADHPHHLGVGMAVPDVAGRNFWGGRTYVRGQGPTELDNHGSQRHLGWLLRDPDGFVEELSWVAGGRQLLLERRTVAVRALSHGADGCWALDFTTALTNVTGETVTIGSPATNGRPGAGYGGFFWRAPRRSEPPRVFSADGEGDSAVHGRPSDWLALAAEDWTLVFAGATGDTRADPWFVRTGDYSGVGSALAWDRRLAIAPADTVTRRIVTAVADGRLDRGVAARIGAQLSDKGATV